MVIQSKYPDLVVPALDFYSYHISNIKQYGNNVAVVDASTNRQLTYNEIHQASIKLASAFTKNNLKKQDVVAVCTSNCIEFSLIVLGVAACNAITTTCNPNYTKMEIQNQLKNCQPKLVVTDSEQLDKFLEISKTVHSIKKIISVDACSKCSSLWPMINEDDGKDFPFHTSFNVHDDVVLLLYSSGTTGLPKGVMLTHQNHVSASIIVKCVNPAITKAVSYSVIPNFHIFGVNRIFHSLNGAKLVLDKRFDVEKFFKAVEKYKVTSFNGVPAMFLEISKSPLARRYDVTSLKSVLSGAAPLAPKVAADTVRNIKVAFSSGWALTETSGVLSGAVLADPSQVAVGLIAPNHSLKVVDPETRTELGVDVDGELLVKGPGVMKGYYKNPKANSTVFEEGWFCTGDIGHYDEHGYIYIVDRMKELIKYKGFQVAPAELESLLLTHPKVQDVGVTGVPDEESGEVPRAFVVKKDPTLTEEELHKFVEANLSKYKHLRGGIYFLDQIPRSDTGKILRRHLKETPVPSKL